MIQLDYRTLNPRWGIRGIKFESWESYSLTLGYLSNLDHYYNLNPHQQHANVSVHVESNDDQGAWDKEGRIHYYGQEMLLGAYLKDLDACSSSGTGRITRRINSNGYIRSLLYDYNFEIRIDEGYTTADVFPTDKAKIKSKLRNQLINERLTNPEINYCLDVFEEGYNLQF